MVATPQSLRTQEIRNPVGAARQVCKGELGVPVCVGIDDLQCRAIPAFRIARKLRVEPIERPIERHWIRPAKSLHGRIVIGAILKQKGARFPKTGHRILPAG